MSKHKYWIRTIGQNGNQEISNDYFQCEISRDSLEIFNNQKSLLNFPIDQLKRIKLDIEILFTAYNFFVLITTNKGCEYRLEVINPLYPKVRTNINYRESKSMVQLVRQLMKKQDPTIEPNPYLRNRFSKQSLNRVEDINLPPIKFYDIYIKRKHRINQILAIVIPGLIVLFGLLFNLLTNN